MAKYLQQCSWDDVPHLPKEARDELWANIPPYQRQARSAGIPELGKGAIYPIAIESIRIPDFHPIPKHWKRVFGFDVAWNWTAASWGAWDETTDTVYIYAVYKRSHAEPSVHKDAIHAKGAWIAGVIDPASRGRSQVDGRKLLDEYRKVGLNLHIADNAVEAGLLATWNRMTTGRLKVFASCAEWFAEFSMYQRKEGGVIKKENDHLMDATRYLVMSGYAQAQPVPEPQPTTQDEYVIVGTMSDNNLSWMG